MHYINSKSKKGLLTIVIFVYLLQKIYCNLYNRKKHYFLTNNGR